MTAAAAQLTGISPQFLVDDLQRSIAHYRQQLGFQLDFQFEDFYASVSRDGCAIHLKATPKTAADRALRQEENHLDAYIGVTDTDALHDEMRANGATIRQRPQNQPWSCRDFQVQDPDGYILCFSQPLV